MFWSTLFKCPSDIELMYFMRQNIRQYFLVTNSIRMPPNKVKLTTVLNQSAALAVFSESCNCYLLMNN
jgi:hypothetical protein